MCPRISWQQRSVVVVTSVVVLSVFLSCARKARVALSVLSASAAGHMFSARAERAIFPSATRSFARIRGHTRRQRMPPETYRQRNVTSGPRVIFPSYRLRYRSSGQSVSSNWHFNHSTLCVPSNPFGYNSVVLLGLIEAVHCRIYQYCFTIIRRL